MRAQMPTLHSWLSLLATALLATVLPAAARAQALPYTLDPVHTRVMLAVDHAGFSQAIGTVSGSTGQLLFDPADWRSAQLDVRVPLDRVDFGDERWNRAVRAGNLLNTARHPQARFVAHTVQPAGERQARVCGTLSLRGVEGPFCLDVTFNQLRRHPLPPFRQTIGFSARGELSRSAFGVRGWPSMVGDVVQLRIELEATRGAGPAADAPPDATAQADAPDSEADVQRAADHLVNTPPEPPDDPQEQP